MKFTTRQGLIISVAINVIILCGFVAKRIYYYNSGHQPQPKPSERSVTWNAIKSELYAPLQVRPGDIVFIGDSHIEGFLVNDYYPRMPVHNRGINGNTTVQVLARLDSILVHKPSKVFVLIGINDLTFGYSPDSVYKNIVRIADKVSAAQATPYIMSIMPVAGEYSQYNKPVIEINARLQQRFKEQFINVHRWLVKGSKLNQAYTFDSIHLNSKGYAKITYELDKYVK